MDTDLDTVSALLRQRDYDAALSLLSGMIAETPDWWNSHYLAGFAYRAKGDLRNAKRCYDRALELNPDEASVLLAAGIVEQQAGRLDQAVALLHKATGVNPQFAEAHNSLGLTLKMRGRPTEALQSYTNGVEALMDAVIGRIAHSPERENYMCDTVTTDGKKVPQMKPAIWKRVRGELKHNILYSTFQNNMGACHADLGDVQQARSCFQKSIQFIPDGMDYEPPRIGLRELEGS